MGQHFLPGNPPIALFLRRSARARRLTLRVSALDGRVTLTLPQQMSDKEALDFAREKEAWLRNHLAKQVPKAQMVEGLALPVEGLPRRICAGQGPRIHLAEDTLCVRLEDGKAGPRLRAWLKARARSRLSAASDRYAAVLGKPYARLALRDTRSRWGSCSSRGTLSYSWRLIMAPPRVLDYVAAHEVAHLAEMNHSRAFWDHVTALFGPHEAERRWLREHGPGLHSFVFEAED